MESKVTLKKISDLLSISISTVSRALKDHPDISLETRTKVKELAEMLDYQPNAYAINLRTNVSKVLGLIVPAISNNFYDSFISEVEKEARKTGYSLMILQSNDDPATEADNIRLCRLNRVAGIFISITAGTTDFTLFNRVEEAGIPIIFFDKVPPQTNYNKVCMADKQAAAKAAELIVNRHKKTVLALFGKNEMSITKERYQAFTSIFETQNGKTNLLIDHVESSAAAFNCTLNYFNNKQMPDAVFCMSDEILIGVMKAVQTLHIKIPQQLSIIAMSNGFIPTLYEPEITYVKTSGYDLGRLSFTKMMSCLQGNNTIEELHTGYEIVEGGSI
jgi:LacI family transcriptional regulator